MMALMPRLGKFSLEVAENKPRIQQIRWSKRTKDARQDLLGHALRGVRLSAKTVRTIL